MFKKTIILIATLFSFNQTVCGKNINRKLSLLEQRAEKEITSIYRAQETIIKVLSKKEISSKTCTDIAGFLGSYWISEKNIKEKLRDIKRKLNYIERKYLSSPSNEADYKKHNECFNQLYNKMMLLERNNTLIVQLT